MKIICVDTPQQKIAACTALLTIGVCVSAYRNDLDMPHSHTEVPTVPTSFSAISAPATNVASPAIYSTNIGALERSK